MRKLFEKIKNKFKKKEAVGSTIIITDEEKKKKDKGYLDIDLIKDNTTPTDKKKFRQYTKSMVTALTVISCFWVTLSYLYAGYLVFFFGNADFLESLSSKTIECIISVALIYCIKALFETALEKNVTPYINSKISNSTDDISYPEMNTKPDINILDDEAEG